MRILIETIKHEQQRYDTVGDWYYASHSAHNDTLVIRVSSLGDEKQELLVGIHELVEAILCKYQGVSQADVDKFDILFERARVEGNESEPGDDSKAPYKRQHCLATAVERMLAAELNVDWSTYDENVSKL